MNFETVATIAAAAGAALSVIAAAFGVYLNRRGRVPGRIGHRTEMHIHDFGDEVVVELYDATTGHLVTRSIPRDQADALRRELGVAAASGRSTPGGMATVG